MQQNFSLSSLPHRPFTLILACYLALTALYFGLGYLSEPHTRVAPTDSCYYYMYVRSLFFDGDLEFTNEITHFMGAERAAGTHTALGRPGNEWSIGPGLFWAPLFLLAHGLTLLLRAFGASLPADGYSALYLSFVWVGNSLYAVGGFYFLQRVLERFCSRSSAVLACLGVMLCSPLTYYFWSLTAMAHNTAFFASSLFLWAVVRYGVGARAVLCGALLFLTRWQAVIYLTPLAFYAVRDLVEGETGWMRRGRWLLKQGALVALLLMAFSPQMLVWKTVYGDFFTVPHGGDFIDFSRMEYVNVLFSLHRGLFAWHPALLLGLGGLFLLRRRDPWLLGAFCLSFAAQVFLVGSLRSWWAGWAFGQRFFIEALPMLGVGVALLLDAVQARKLLRNGLLAALLALAVWNQLFVFQYQYGLIPREYAPTSAQFFSDKYHLGERLEGKRALKRALQAYEAGDMAAFFTHAQQAFALAPHDKRTALAAGYAAVKAGEWRAALPAFAMLMAERPDDALYAQALAGAVHMSGEKERAARIAHEGGAEWPTTREKLESALHERMVVLVNG